eukprot:2605470-Alexandrium_andersonii.AAC.1
MSPDLEPGLTGVAQEQFQTAFLDQRPPVMPPDMALSNVIRYGSPEQVFERTVSRPKANEITQS